MSEILTAQNGEDSNDERPRLVLDTNTVLALWMFRDPKLEALRKWIEAGKCLLLSSEDTLEELRRVLEYRQFGLSTLNQAEIRANYLARALVLAPRHAKITLPACRDADDQKFLELATAVNATYLITRDKALLRLARHRNVRDRVTILTPERLQHETLLLAADRCFATSSCALDRLSRTPGNG